MNGFIFDWEENCEKILETNKYTSGAHQVMEQVVLLKYLADRGEPKDKIFDIWKNTGSLLVKRSVDDHEDISEVFEKLWTTSKTWTMLPSAPVTVYQSEIDFINKMAVPMWLKEYVLTLLCVYKYYGLKWCKYEPRLKVFCYSVTSQKREREELVDKVSECLQKYKPYEVAVFDVTPHLKVNFAKKSGVEVGTIRNPRHVQELFHLLKNYRTCPHCGKEYEYTAQTLRLDMCPDCRKKARYRQQYQCRKRKQARDRHSSGK